jgi:hypothetical protein
VQELVQERDERRNVFELGRGGQRLVLEHGGQRLVLEHDGQRIVLEQGRGGRQNVLELLEEEGQMELGQLAQGSKLGHDGHGEDFFRFFCLDDELLFFPFYPA